LNGWRAAWDKTRKYVGFRLLGSDLDGLVDLRRTQLSEELSERFHATVQYGPFRGMQFPESSWWGRRDRACMLLGMYEQEVQELLVEVSPGRSTFVDVGAADGFYAVGALVSGLFSRTIAFEMSEEGRQTISESARLNHVEARITIEGHADKQFVRQLKDFDPADTVILVDIEAGEFELFDEGVFSSLAGGIVIIELHHQFRSDGDALLRKLLSQSEAHFEHRLFSMGARDLSKFSEVHAYPDNCRWLLCAESRPLLMSWVVLQPRRPIKKSDAKIAME